MSTLTSKIDKLFGTETHPRSLLSTDEWKSIEKARSRHVTWSELFEEVSDKYSSVKSFQIAFYRWQNRQGK